MREYQPTEDGWRNSFVQELEEQKRDLRQLRSQGSNQEIEIPGEQRRVAAWNLSDIEIGNIAHRRSETVINHAIWETTYSQRAMKNRLGIAQ